MRTSSILVVLRLSGAEGGKMSSIENKIDIPVKFDRDAQPDFKIGRGIISAINCTKVPGYEEVLGAIDCTGPADFFSGASAVEMLVAHSISDATRRALRNDLQHFRDNGGVLPATPETVANYIAWMAEHGYAVATVSRHIASISKAHRSLGERNPCRSELVKQALRGMKRMKGTAQREAKPLLKEDLFAILDMTGNRMRDKRDRTLLLLGFAGGFRRSELVGLNVEDVAFDRKGMIVTIRRSKTDQEGKGRKLGIPFGRGRWCPVKVLEEWLEAAEITSGPIFRPINRHSQVGSLRLSGEAVSIVVKERVAKIGQTVELFSGHSLRAGFATSAAMAGASSHSIRRQTGHTSDAILSRYIRHAEMFEGNAASLVL